MTSRYRIRQRIAAGGMAEVFVVEALEAPMPLVMKRMLPHLRDERAFVQMFTSESRLAMKLRHENIVRVVDEGRDDEGSPFMVMERLEGLDVYGLQWAASESHEQLPIAAACAIVAGAARGLAFAHALRDEHGRPLGVVHRDVSPHNTFVTRSGAVKVLDFGIAKSAEQLARTRTGEVKGKMGYMAPEQVMGSGVALDARCDLYALGVMLWELLAGKRLWKRDNDLALARAICEESPGLPSDARPEVPRELDRLTLSLLSIYPADRPADANAVAHELEAIARSLRPGDAAEELAAIVARYEPMYARRNADSDATDDSATVLMPGTVTSVGVMTASRRREPSGRRRWMLAAVAAVALLGFGVGGAAALLRARRPLPRATVVAIPRVSAPAAIEPVIAAVSREVSDAAVTAVAVDASVAARRATVVRRPRTSGAAVIDPRRDFRSEYDRPPR